MDQYNPSQGAKAVPVRTGISYLDTTVYSLDSLQAPGTGQPLSLGLALSRIQESPYSQRIKQARKAGKGSSKYEQLKKSIPCFSWNVSLYKDHYRNAGNALQLSGLMYFDRDEAGDIQELAVLPELVCAWTSFGGKGDGFLVAVEGLNSRNFKSTWKALQERFAKRGLKVDTSCSNIDRANVLSFSDVFMPEEVTPFQAVEPAAAPAPIRPANPLQDTDQTYTNLKKWLANKGQYYADGNRNHYLVKLAAACNRYGIDQATAAGLMVHDFEHAASHVPAEEIEKKVAAIYRKNVSDFGSQAFKKGENCELSQKAEEKQQKAASNAGNSVFDSKSFLTSFDNSLYNKSQRSEKKNTVREQLLETGQRLSDLALDFSQTQYIDSPTGSGKTAAVILSGTAFDMLVPTQDQAKQVGHEYQVDYVSEGRQPTAKPQQVGTYNAIDKFIQRDTSERTLVIDEAHNLALAQGYRSEALNRMLDQAARYKNLILLSGTPVKSCHPLLANTPTTRIRRANPPRKEMRIVRYSHKLDSLIARLERGKLQTVVIQSKTRGEELAELLRAKGYKVQCFNANTKEEEQHRQIIEKCNVDEGIDVLIATGLFFEGLNVYNTNIGAIHLLSPVSRYQIAQLYERYRKQAPEKLLQYRSVEADIEQDIDFDWDGTQRYFLGVAHALAATEQIAPANGAASIADSILKSVQGELKHLTRYTGTWEVNYLGVDYLTVEAETAAMNKSIKLQERLLSEYGFYLSGIDDDTAIAQDQELSKQYKEVAAAVKSKEQVNQIANLHTFEMGGLGYVIEAEKDRNQDTAKLARRLLELEKYVPFLQAVALIRPQLKDGPLTDNKYRMLRDQVRIQRYLQLQSKEGLKTPETRMIDALCNLFTPGEKVTTTEIQERLQKIRSKHFRTNYVTFNEYRAMRVFRQFFEFKRTKRPIPSAGGSDKWENCYQVISNNPLGLQLEPVTMAAA